MTQSNDKKTGFPGCCGWEFPASMENAKELSEMMKKFCGEEGSFDCSKMMEMFKDEDGTFNIDRMMEMYRKMTSSK